MIRKLFAIMLALCAVTFAGGLVESTLTTAGTEQSLSTLNTAYQAGTNTYLLYNSTNASDTQNITVKYMTSAFVFKSATYALTGKTQLNTSAATNYIYNIPTNATSAATTFELNNWTLKAGGTCANYSNVYYVSGTVRYTSDMNATSASDTANVVSGGMVRMPTAQVTTFATTGNTYFDTVWYYYNPALTQNVYVNSVDNVLPQGQEFIATTAIIVSGASTNLNNSWKNNSNHSEGYVNGVITILPNADKRSFNVTSNETYPVLAYGYVIIPSASLVQNKRVIVSAVEAAKCVNATLSRVVNDAPLNASRYTVSGSVMAGTTDAAYVYAVTLSSAASGNVTVKSVAGTTLYSVLVGATAPVDNGASPMCLNSNGCTLTNMMYGGDGLWKMSARIWGASANTTKMAVYQAAGSSVFGFGSNLITWNIGQRLVFFGKPYANDTNISLFYEGG